MNLPENFTTVAGIRIDIGVGAACAVVALIAFWIIALLRRVVPPNEVHVVRSKTKTILYGAGQAHSGDGKSTVTVDSKSVYYAWPSWLPLLGVDSRTFPKTIFAVSLEAYEAYDKGRLPFEVNVQAFFRIDDFERAAARMQSALELRAQLSGVLQGVVRRILATNELENIMQDRSVLGEQFTKEIDAQLTQWGVTTSKTIEFMDIRDHKGSEVIANIMAKEKSRIEMESRTRVAENFRAAVTAEIEAQQQIDLRKQEAEQLVGERTATTKRIVGIAGEKAHQEIQVEARTTAERTKAVQQMNDVRAAEIKRDVAVVDAEAQRQVAVVRANADKEVAVTRALADKEVKVTNANGDKESTILIAEGNLISQRNNAEGIEAVGLAQGVADKAKLMAPVDAQITLADKIGGDEKYQQYLVSVRNLEAVERIGISNAKALEAADIKVIVNGGTISEGLGSVGEIFSAKGGTKLGALISALANNPDVVSVVEKVTESKK
jgi:flotillin